MSKGIKNKNSDSAGKESRLVKAQKKDVKQSNVRRKEGSSQKVGPQQQKTAGGQTRRAAVDPHTYASPNVIHPERTGTVKRSPVITHEHKVVSKEQSGNKSVPPGSLQKAGASKSKPVAGKTSEAKGSRSQANANKKKNGVISNTSTSKKEAGVREENRSKSDKIKMKDAKDYKNGKRDKTDCLSTRQKSPTPGTRSRTTKSGEKGKESTKLTSTPKERESTKLSSTPKERESTKLSSTPKERESTKLSSTPKERESTNMKTTKTNNLSNVTKSPKLPVMTEPNVTASNQSDSAYSTLNHRNQTDSLKSSMKTDKGTGNTNSNTRSPNVKKRVTMSPQLQKRIIPVREQSPLPTKTAGPSKPYDQKPSGKKKAIITSDKEVHDRLSQLSDRRSIDTSTEDQLSRIYVHGTPTSQRKFSTSPQLKKRFSTTSSSLSTNSILIKGPGDCFYQGVRRVILRKTNVFQLELLGEVYLLCSLRFISCEFPVMPIYHCRQDIFCLFKIISRLCLCPSYFSQSKGSKNVLFVAGAQNFDVIKFATYRTACKLRFIQKKTNCEYEYFVLSYIYIRPNRTSSLDK